MKNPILKKRAMIVLYLSLPFGLGAIIFGMLDIVMHTTQYEVPFLTLASFMAILAAYALGVAYADDVVYKSEVSKIKTRS